MLFCFHINFYSHYSNYQYDVALDKVATRPFGNSLLVIWTSDEQEKIAAALAKHGDDMTRLIAAVSSTKSPTEVADFYFRCIYSAAQLESIELTGDRDPQIDLPLCNGLRANGGGGSNRGRGYTANAASSSASSATSAAATVNAKDNSVDANVASAIDATATASGVATVNADSVSTEANVDTATQATTTASVATAVEDAAKSGIAADATKAKDTVANANKLQATGSSESAALSVPEPSVDKGVAVDTSKGIRASSSTTTAKGTGHTGMVSRSDAFADSKTASLEFLMK